MGREEQPVVEGKLQPDDPLFKLIERAYDLFDVQKPKSTEVCVHCCMDPAIEADFFRPPIRNLPFAYVRDWFSAAYDPPGIAKETWAYLLPRILEILAAGEEPSAFGIEVSLGRFDTGNPDNWSPQQWQVLDGFQRAFLDWKVQQVDYVALDDVLCMFRLGGWPLGDLLAQVAALPTPLLVRRFWQDWCAGPGPGSQSVWITAFWEGADQSTVYDFYTSKELHRLIAKVALDADVDRVLAEKAGDVASLIEVYANW